ncbi:MAG: hypothetical protein VB957_10200 [Pseudomonadales bacterium]|jgi:uncharacterized pyridoxamine 5'-phosphate oxidase family protein
MKALKIAMILLFTYAGIVVLFESMLGYFQPADQSTLVITTTSPEGVSNDRVLARLTSKDKLYVAANHWPRAWYKHTLQNPNVQIMFEGEKKNYLAVKVEGEEHNQVNMDNELGIGFRILTAFPPRYFFWLDPV